MNQEIVKVWKVFEYFYKVYYKISIFFYIIPFENIFFPSKNILFILF